MVDTSDTAAVYSERITPSLLAWLLAPGTGAIFLVMFLPVSTLTAVIIALLATGAVAGWLWSFAARIQITKTHLIVGRAEIELSALGDLEMCDAQKVRHYMGPGSDARSFVLTRPWVKTAIYVEQLDPRDPTPYWLFSTRDPESIITHVDKLRNGKQ